MLVGIAAVAVVGLGVGFGTVNTHQFKQSPWISAGSLEAVRFVVQLTENPTSDPTVGPPVLMGDGLIAIAEGGGDPDQMDGLIPPPDVLRSTYPSGALLYANFTGPRASKMTTRSWGWPLRWHIDDVSRAYGDYRAADRERVQPRRDLRKPQLIRTHVLYDTRRKDRVHTVHWDLAGPAATLLVLVVARLLVGIGVRVLYRGRSDGAAKRVRRSLFWTIALVVLLVNVLSINEASTWLFSSHARPVSSGRAPSESLIVVPSDEVLALAQNGSDPRAVARAVLARAPSPPTRDQIVHLVLGHPQNVERTSKTFSMAGPLSMGSTSRSQLVQVHSTGAGKSIARLIGVPHDGRLFYYERWSTLTLSFLSGPSVPTAIKPGHVRSVTINVASLVLVVFMLWVVWVATSVTGRLWVGLRTGRRKNRRLCTHCGYPAACT